MVVLNSVVNLKRNVNNELNAQKSLTLQHSTSNQRFERELHSQLPANAAIGVALFSKDSKEKVREAQVEKEQVSNLRRTKEAPVRKLAYF